ncbi:uncharacterized protein LOC119995336 [Tripterygium wilfordii]|uniref:uncharacterized protein LOC119995336 n=1 Tax=Tripterygium wilfordii TaxID=458696 RepID=UPI0018F8560B|nr:uncharacterized protein LOC119995336 [Tripterygium wilfordii]
MEDDELHTNHTKTNQLQHLENNIIYNENNDHGEEHCLQDITTTSSELMKADYTSEFITYDIYKSKDQLISWARGVAIQSGHVLTIRASDCGGNGRKPRVLLACERFGSYRPTISVDSKNAKKRLTTGTKKCGCPFLLKGKKNKTGDGWVLEVINGTHNHPDVEYFEGHSYAGRLTHEQTELLVDMSKNLVRPKEILCTINNSYPSNATTLRTIYNARQRHRVIEKAGRTQMQYLLGKLFDLKYYEYHRSSVDDCTYKTNRYWMPLLEVVGITSTSLTFSIAFAYIGGERIDNYLWVLQRLRSIMEDNSIELPSVIVTDWELSLMSAIENVFPDAQHLLYNEDDYLRRVNDLMTTFNRNPSPVEYVLDTWLNPYKERELRIFMVEDSFSPSAGVRLPKSDHFPSLGVNGVKDANSRDICLVRENEQLKFVDSSCASSDLCCCVSRRTYGIPCSYELARYVRDDVPIPLSALDTHWSRLQIIPRDPLQIPDFIPELNRYVSQVMKEDPSKWSYYQRKIRETFDPNTTQLTEPRDKFKTRGRLSKAELSTRRAPSAFELVDSTCIDKSSQSSKLTSTDKKIFVKKNQANQGRNKLSCDKYINDIVNVADDGNCGYRAVAELNTWEGFYTKIFGDRTKDHLIALNYYESPADMKYWMTMPDMRHLIATRYNIVVVLLSRHQCLTFLPLRSRPKPYHVKNIIALGFVNGNHFVQVSLIDDCPIPLVALYWHRYHTIQAEGWDEPYQNRITQFTELTGSDVATRETFDIDSD